MFNRGVVHIVVAVYIVAHYCLMFNRGVVHIVVAVYIVEQYKQPQQYEPLLCQALNSNGQQYNQPQQFGPLLC
jgi:hypothetical protein